MNTKLSKLYNKINWSELFQWLFVFCLIIIIIIIITSINKGPYLLLDSGSWNESVKYHHDFTQKTVLIHLNWGELLRVKLSYLGNFEGASWKDFLNEYLSRNDYIRLRDIDFKNKNLLSEIELRRAIFKNGRILNYNEDGLKLMDGLRTKDYLFLPIKWKYLDKLIVCKKLYQGICYCKNDFVV